MGDDLNNSTTESKSLSEGGVASFVALCMLAHQPRDGAAPFEFLGVEWGPGGGFEGTGKYIRNNTLYPWHWTTSGGYKNGNIFGNALWDIFDGLEGLPGYGTCPDISPSSFLQNCAARDTLLVRLAYGLRATAGNQSFRTVAEAMLEGDYLAGGSNLRMMLDAFDSHGWFFTRYDTTYGIQFRPVIIPADADSAIRTLALHLHSHTGVKPDSVFVHYNAISQEPVVQLMTYDPDLGAHVAFMDVEAYTFENNHIHYLVSAVNQVNGPSAPGVTVYWPKNAPADTTANFWYGDRLSRLHFASTQEETIPAGQERTLTLGVAAPSSIVLDVNVNIRIENDGHLIPEADWFLEAPGGSRVTLVRNLFKDHVSWPDFFDVWFDDELDAPCESFIPWDFSGPTYTPPSLATFDSLDVEGTWKLIINNNVGGAEPIVVSQWGLQFRTEPFPVIGIDEVESRPARHSMVGDPIPNPFNPITLFPVYLESPALVQFRIYDVAGRLVRELVNERMYQGEYTVKWDGHDEGGIPASSGVYFYRVTLGDRAFTGKSVLIK